ncbi:hypothetical protein L0N23_23185 [Bacteroides intestinalis]|jgi:hypothetical protein|uniref:HEAT repeat domain-containing protein n=2 Tax=Bacteroides intestinalis TaxID=329854 RepID=A0A415NE15_9BACE|nr:hypothetical protein [Bacteroides intestinalis]MBS5494865.1 hypothetical protein [Bacteroides intestinalis]MCB6674909.1 hypothetical protein [Bacteroides intestinalis]MCB7012829.1 hypothetical protein [Bacteroides intestinalis]MCG4699824.1 hypothetical protein [Bacteroides intestinalis]MCG4716134.1 hypothetical protein [Bacteroides intestinalis]
MHDMEKIDEYKNTLAMPLCKLSIDKLVQEICLHPEYLKDIYQLISDDKIVVSWRAIWACEKVSEKHPDWFVPLLDDIIQRLLVCQHDGSKRLLLSILYNVPASDPVSVDLLNYCLDHMLAPQESIGVQALSIRMAYQLCKSEPELLKELQLILENADTEYYSTGVKTTIRNILKKINK